MVGILWLDAVTPIPDNVGDGKIATDKQAVDFLLLGLAR